MKQRSHKIVMTVTFDKPVTRSQAIKEARKRILRSYFITTRFPNFEKMTIRGFKSRDKDCAPVARPAKPEPFALDWDLAPFWAKYAAMDRDGTWYWFDQELVPGISTWECLGYGAWRVKAFSAPPFPDDWKDSLQERPQ